MAATTINLSYNLAAITDKFNQRLPEALRIIENKANPFMVFMKDTRAIMGVGPDYVLPTDCKIPTLDIKSGVEFVAQYGGLAHEYNSEGISFDKRITNQLPLLPEDNANIGPNTDVTSRITRDALIMAQKTANEFATKVICNNTLAQMTAGNISDVAKTSLTGQYVYKDINDKIDFLVANGFMPAELAVVAAPNAIQAYNQGRRLDKTMIFSPEVERTLMTAAGVRMYSGKATWLQSKFEFKADSGDSTKKIYEPTSDAKQVWYIVAPIEAIYWDIAEAHSEIGAIPNSPGIAGSFMERLGSLVRKERKDYVFAVTETKA